MPLEVALLCPYCGKPLKWLTNRKTPDGSGVSYDAWCPVCLKLLYKHLPTTERPLLPTEELLQQVQEPEAWQDRIDVVQGTLARWKVVRGMFLLLVSDDGTTHSARGEWRGWSLQLGSWIDAGPETGEPGKDACRAAYLRACGLKNLATHPSPPNRLTWVPKEIGPDPRGGSFPEPDGKHRVHLCYYSTFAAATVYLEKGDVYWLGYDGLGHVRQSWPLGTSNLQGALARAETLLGWADFKPETPCQTF